MPVLLKLRCDDCGAVFRVPQEDGFPDFCPKCGVDQRVPDPDFVPSQINIGGSDIARAADQAYRDLEASPAGITDLNDNLRAGDVAAKPAQPSQQYTEQVKSLAPDYSPWQAAGGVTTTDALAMAKQGRERTTGARALGAIQSANTGVTPIPGVRGSWGGGR